MSVESLLQPGDCLCYAGRGLTSWLIKVKTWSDVSHVSGYLGDGRAAASRDGQGVGEYPLRLDGLYAVLRPTVPFDLGGARRYLVETTGQRYDWWGLFRFFKLGKPSLDRQFCSEFLTRWYRAAGVQPFAARYDADLVSPGMFLSAPCFDVVWTATATQASEASTLASAPAKVDAWMRDRPSSAPIDTKE